MSNNNRNINNSNIKIGFIHDYFSSFIENDYKILSKHFDTTKTKCFSKNDLLKIVNIVQKTDVTYLWFAENKAFFTVLISKLLNKKCVVVAGGYDVACVPSINYGICNKHKINQLARNYVLRHSSAILPVSKSTENECIKLVNNTHNMTLVYNGINTDKYKPNGTKEDIVISVGYINDSTLKKKGFEAFVKTSKLLPNIKFILIGEYSNSVIKHLKSINNNNIEYTGFISNQKLIEYYQKAKIYVQVSEHESFGVAIAEAMACNCIPIVSNRGAIPEVVGDTGFYVNCNDTTAIAAAITKTLKSKTTNETRDRILNNFTIEHREKQIVDIIKRIV